MSCSTKALEYFNHFNCAQAVLAGCGTLTGLEEARALAVAGSFGGGMRHGGVCGAVTGGLMALGLIFPYINGDDSAARDKIARLTVELQRRFTEKFGCMSCRELVKGAKSAARQTVCREAVILAVQIVEDLAAEVRQSGT